MKHHTLIPTQPGVYIHKDAQGEIIYVGKAKNLRKRVANYTANRPHDPKTRALIALIADTEVVVTHNELEALLLENRLIKQHRPKFNIQLKDNRRYSYIQVTNEQYPRVLVSRTPNKKDRFFGPYTFSIREIPKIASELFGIRRCPSTQKKPCFYYTLGFCSGACAGAITPEDYAKGVKEFIYFVTHPANECIEYYKTVMQQAAAAQEFEKALRYKHRIAILEQFKEKQVVDRTNAHDQDVIGVASIGDSTVIAVLTVKRGVIMSKEQVTVMTSDDVLSEFLKAYYSTRQIPHEILVEGSYDPVIIDYLVKLSGRAVTIATPLRGIGRDLLMIAKKNAYAQLQIEDPVLIELKELLGLSVLPITIDCFDISNYGDKVIVGACVQFRNGKPHKQGWRHYTIRGDFGQDDFRSMHEVIKRRYATTSLPDLIIIDGGVVQVDFAKRALAELCLSTAVIGLAKQEETIIFPDGRGIRLNKRTESAKLVMRIRDAVHAFAIGHSRARYAELYKHSELDVISGIGPKTKFALLHAFGSLQAIKSASIEMLTQVIGASRAKKLRDYFGDSEL